MGQILHNSHESAKRLSFEYINCRSCSALQGSESSTDAEAVYYGSIPADDIDGLQRRPVMWKMHVSTNQ